MERPDFFELNNGEKVKLPFSDIEYKNRVSKLRDENKKQNKPAIATVVNLGVSFLQRKVTEKTENPIDEVIPNMKPITEFFSVLPSAIIIIPIVARIIEIQTLMLILSFKNKNASNAVKKGIAAKHNKVIAAVVFVIE